MKHSTITNPADLHYAKVRTFTGNPALVSPDFPDQILVATDTNKAYRSTSTALIELVPPVSQEQSPAFSLIGSGYPAGQIPNNDGSLYFDLQDLILYIFKEGVWIPIQNNLNISVSLSNASNYNDSDITLALYYSEYEPYPPFDFTDLVDSIPLGNSVSAVGAQISNLIHSRGLGYYAFGVDFPIDVSVVGLSLYNTDSNAFSTSLYESGITANGNPIPSTAIRFSDYPARLLEASIAISLN